MHIMPNSLNVGDDTPTPATRLAAYALVVTAITAGLPIPEGIHLYGFHRLELSFDRGDTDAVDRWAAYLGLPAAELDKTARNGGQFRSYYAYLFRGEALPGWSINVRCSVPVAPPTVER